jgi:short-subunit dehydrogenase
VKNIVIIGGSGGIGLALTKHFASKNYNVISTYYSNQPNKIIGVNNLKLDLKSENSIIEFSSKLQELGILEIHTLIFSSVSYHSISLLEEQNFSNVLDDYLVNVIGPQTLMKHLIGFLKIRKYSNVIFLLGGGQGPKRSLSTYLANKWALIGLIESLAEELCDYRMNINGLYPGPLHTKFLERLQKLGSDIIGVELYTHVENNIRKFDVVSEELLKTTDFLSNLNFKFSGKVVSARYDSIYTLTEKELNGSHKYIFERIK